MPLFSVIQVTTASVFFISSVSSSLTKFSTFELFREGGVGVLGGEGGEGVLGGEDVLGGGE